MFFYLVNFTYSFFQVVAELGLLYNLGKKKLQHNYRGLHKKLQTNYEKI